MKKIEVAVVRWEEVDIVQAMIGAEIEKAKLTIQNLGTLGDTGSLNVIDLGGFF